MNPIQITPECIELGENVFIHFHSRIQGIFIYEGVRYNPVIKIGESVSIQQNLHLTCANSVIIGRNTAIGANVTITDINHPYENIDTPIEHQQLVVKDVEIGEDCKIYNNSVILPGVHIGKHVTVGANSVVTSDLPDYCVAVGAPARVIRIYDKNKQQWTKAI